VGMMWPGRERLPDISHVRLMYYGILGKPQVSGSARRKVHTQPMMPANGGGKTGSI